MLGRSISQKMVQTFVSFLHCTENRFKWVPLCGNTAITRTILQLKTPSLIRPEGQLNSYTYFQKVFYEWNVLDDHIKHSRSISDFKRNLLAIIRSLRTLFCDGFETKGIQILNKLPMNFSALNEHRFRHSF